MLTMMGIYLIKVILIGVKKFRHRSWMVFSCNMHTDMQECECSFPLLLNKAYFL